MTPAGEYLNIRYGKDYKERVLDRDDAEHLINHFTYLQLKNLYNSLGKEMSSETILQTISNYKEKFHQYD